MAEAMDGLSAAVHGETRCLEPTLWGLQRGSGGYSGVPGQPLTACGPGRMAELSLMHSFNKY